MKTSSLNFHTVPKLPNSSGIAGALIYKVELLPSEISKSELVVIHRRVPTEDIGGIALDYEGNYPNPIVPIDGVADVMYNAIYPFPIGYGYREILPPYYDFYSDFVLKAQLENRSDDLNNDIDMGTELLMDKQISMRESAPSLLFGWLPEGTVRINGYRPVDHTVGYGNADLGSKEYRWILSHEAGHYLLDNEKHSDRSENLDEFGWDVVGALNDLTLAKPLSKTQFMDPLPGQDQDPFDYWIRADQYTQVQNNKTAAPAPTPTPVVLRTVRGSTFLTDTWKLEYSVADWRSRPHQQSSIGDGEIRLFDDQQVQLYSTKFETTYEVTQTNRYPISIEVPALATADSIKLYKDGILQDTIQRTANSPLITITAPTTGQVITDTFSVSAALSDADGDSLRSYVQYSPDGTNWVSLRSVFTGTLPVVDSALLAGTQTGIIRVVATDGFNTATAEVTGLNVSPDKAPTAVIISPNIANRAYLEGTNVVLVGSAYDLEDGKIMADASLSWSSSIDGFLGNGLTIETPDLSTGSHTITFQVTDSDNNTTSATVVLDVN